MTKKEFDEKMSDLFLFWYTGEMTKEEADEHAKNLEREFINEQNS